MNCPSCGAEIFEIDVKCTACGAAVGASGAHRMIGQVFLGQYELVDVLGQGGMSVVYKGRHNLTGQEVALKILPPELAAHSQVKSRFLEEAKALATLDHGNIVHLYNFGQENGSFVLAMQFVQGKTWERIILENKRMDWQSSCRITVDVLRALEYAHGRGVIHRDMKPSNVLVRAHDASATVMDFGIAKMTTSTKLTATGQTMGTVRYMSPEQVRGQEVDPRTDLYSLGATLYESLTGDTPFDGSTHFEIMTKHLSEPARRPSELGVAVPRVIEDAVMRCLMKRPDDRFADAREMRKILEAALRDGDLGFSETQKVSREVLGDLRATVPAATAAGGASALEAAPTPRRLAVATPTGGLAGVLEPTTGAATVPVRRSRSWLWIGLALLVLAGGGATAALMLRGGGAAPGLGIHGVTIRAQAVIDGVHVYASGALTPAQLHGAYWGAFVELRTRADGQNVALVPPIQELVAIPRAAFCEPTAYPGGAVPSDCASLVSIPVALSSTTQRLLVIDEPSELTRAMQRGVAEAICVQEGLTPAVKKLVCTNPESL